MRSKIIGVAVFTASLCLVLACITVNIYFPEAAVKQAASEIVDEVRQQNTNDKDTAEPAIRGQGRSPGAAASPWSRRLSLCRRRRSPTRRSAPSRTR